MAKFVLTGVNKGKTISLGGCDFVEGVYECADHDAEWASKILSKYYGAVLNPESPKTEPTPATAKASK